MSVLAYDWFLLDPCPCPNMEFKYCLFIISLLTLDGLPFAMFKNFNAAASYFDMVFAPFSWILGSSNLWDYFWLLYWSILLSWDASFYLRSADCKESVPPPWRISLEICLWILLYSFGWLRARPPIPPVPMWLRFVIYMVNADFFIALGASFVAFINWIY